MGKSKSASVIVRDVIESGYHGVLLILGAYVSYQFTGMSNSIQELNSNVAVLIEKVTSATARLEKLEGAVFKPRR